jgi:hypothetical protein
VLGLITEMDASSKDGFVALLGLLSALYGLGMAFFAWLRPKSAYYPFFKPRWRFGIKASRGAAFVQAPLYLSLGGLLLFGALQSTIAQIFWYSFVASVILSVGIFFVDWGSADEP